MCTEILIVVNIVEVTLNYVLAHVSISLITKMISIANTALKNVHNSPTPRIHFLLILNINTFVNWYCS